MSNKLAGFSELDIVKGLVPGHRIITRFSENPDISTTEEDIWSAGGVLVYLASAEQMNVKSDDINDTAAGSGMRTLSILGLDANFNEIGETITLNGITNVLTTLSYLRIISLKGVTGNNVGTITATAATAATLQASIAIGKSQSMMSHFTVPAGHTFVMVSSFGATGTGKELRFRGRVKSATLANSSDRIVRSTVVFENSFTFNDAAAISEKTDFRVTGISLAAGTTAEFTYRGILIANDFIGSPILLDDPTLIS